MHLFGKSSWPKHSTIFNDHRWMWLYISYFSVVVIVERFYHRKPVLFPRIVLIETKFGKNHQKWPNIFTISWLFQSITIYLGGSHSKSSQFSILSQIFRNVTNNRMRIFELNGISKFYSITQNKVFALNNWINSHFLFYSKNIKYIFLIRFEW